MELLSAYPDAEDIGLALFESLASTALATPVDLVPPLVVVRRMGGFDDGITDQARLQVQAFGSTHATARDLAEACRQRVIAAPATAVAGAIVDRAGTDGAPAYVDYGQPGIHRFIANYWIEYRRPR